MFDILVISPYTDEDPAVECLRAEQTNQYIASLIQQGFIVYSTISALSHVVTRYEIPSDYSYWKRHCHRMIEMSSKVHVLMLDGWAESVGVADEIKTTRKLGKDFVMIPWIDPDVIHIPTVWEI